MWLRDSDAGSVCGSGDNRGTELIEPAGAVDVADRHHTTRGDEAPHPDAVTTAVDAVALARGDAAPEPDAVAAAVDAAMPAGGTGRRLRILVHDFAGHPFQVDLSRALARRGHTVQHVHCVGYTSGKGAFDTQGLSNLRVVGLPTGGTFDRYSATRRFRQEVAYARRFDDVAEAFAPDVLLACNVPLVAKAVTAAWCARKGIPWVFWLQDLHGVAMRREAEKRAGTAGKALGATFELVERALLRRADAVVSITPDFVPMLDRCGVDAARRTVN